MSSGRLLLTGATGFIGGYLLRELQSKGYEVTVAVRSEQNLQQLGDHVSTLWLDYFSTEQMTTALASVGGFDYVVHNAGVTKCCHPETFLEVNCGHTTRLLRALEQQPRWPKCFLYMSSMGSYSPNTTLEPLRSDSPQHPVTYYGRSKLAAEWAVQGSPIPHVILCATGVYGKGDQDYVLSIKSMQKGFNFVSGTEPQLLSFVYVVDVARAVSFLLECPRSYGHKYLLSDGHKYTDRDFTQIVSELIGRKVHEVRVPTSVIRAVCYTGDRVGKLIRRPLLFNRDKYHILTQHNWHCDISPILELGFRPQYDLRSGLSEALGCNH